MSCGVITSDWDCRSCNFAANAMVWFKRPFYASGLYPRELPEKEFSPARMKLARLLLVKAMTSKTGSDERYLREN
ncbi:hypothetical protein [Mesorhizobium sanjuanii]|uniref:hypothetical protein n=1 Tax=Mesorhizobium sanjuanii TaxID=2037900 RepID=UPI0013FD9AF4|nr:hypothetical protein [Mesorhizobium sanjuanii]